MSSAARRIERRIPPVARRGGTCKPSASGLSWEDSYLRYDRGLKTSARRRKDLDFTWASEARTITIGVGDPNAHGPFHLVTECQNALWPLSSFIEPNLDLHLLDPGLSFSLVTLGTPL